MKELELSWICAVRPSRQPLRGFLRMRNFLNVIKAFPHAEERPEGASRSTHDRNAVNSFTTSEERPTGASRRTHDRDAALYLNSFHTLEGRDPYFPPENCFGERMIDATALQLQ